MNFEQQTQFETVVTERDDTHEKGLFKRGAQITVDIDDMVAYHGGITWNIAVVEPGKKFKLLAFNTVFETVEVAQ